MTTTTPSSSSFPIRFGMWTNNLRFCLHLNQWGSVIWVWSEKHGWVLIEGSICFSSHIWRSLMNYKIEWLFRNTSSIGMIEWEISIKTLGQTKRKRIDETEMISMRIYTICMCVCMCEECQWYKFVLIYVQWMNEWREEKEREREKSLRRDRCCHPFLNMSLSNRCACLSLFVNFVVHTFYQSTKSSLIAR